jgi:hypothetical protein
MPPTKTPEPGPVDVVVSRPFFVLSPELNENR